MIFLDSKTAILFLVDWMYHAKMIVYKKTDMNEWYEWYIEWQQMVQRRQRWYNEWQRMILIELNPEV